MKKILRIFLLYSRFSLKTTFQHPVGVIFFTIGKFMRFATYLLFILILLSKTKTLVGYNLYQTLIFFLTYNVIDTSAQLLFREVYRFRPLVVSGELDGILLRPHHPFLRILIGGIDPIDFLTVIFYLGLLVFFAFQLPAITFLNVIIFILLLINGLVIATAFHIIVLALGILTTEVDHTIMIYRDITRVATVPMDIYREPIRSLFTFILPIGIMITFPAKSLFGMLSTSFIFISFLISLLLLLFSLQLWNRALKKYQSWGG